MTTDNPQTIDLTTEMVAESLSISKDEAYLLIRFGEARGWITKAGALAGANGKGRGPVIYRIPVDLGARIASLWTASRTTLVNQAASILWEEPAS